MIEKIVNKMLEDMNNIEGKDILTEAVKDKLNKSFELYDIDTDIDLDTEEYTKALNILTSKVGY